MKLKGFLKPIAYIAVFVFIILLLLQIAGSILLDSGFFNNIKQSLEKKYSVVFRWNDISFNVIRGVVIDRLVIMQDKSKLFEADKIYINYNILKSIFKMKIFLTGVNVQNSLLDVSVISRLNIKGKNKQDEKITKSNSKGVLLIDSVDIDNMKILFNKNKFVANARLSNIAASSISNINLKLNISYGKSNINYIGTLNSGKYNLHFVSAGFNIKLPDFKGLNLEGKVWDFLSNAIISVDRGSFVFKNKRFYVSGSVKLPSPFSFDIKRVVVDLRLKTGKSLISIKGSASSIRASVRELLADFINPYLYIKRIDLSFILYNLGKINIKNGSVIFKGSSFTGIRGYYNIINGSGKIYMGKSYIKLKRLNKNIKGSARIKRATILIRDRRLVSLSSRVALSRISIKHNYIKGDIRLLPKSSLIIKNNRLLPFRCRVIIGKDGLNLKLRTKNIFKKRYDISVRANVINLKRLIAMIKGGSNRAKTAKGTSYKRKSGIDIKITGDIKKIIFSPVAMHNVRLDGSFGKERIIKLQSGYRGGNIGVYIKEKKDGYRTRIVIKNYDIRELKGLLKGLQIFGRVGASLTGSLNISNLLRSDLDVELAVRDGEIRNSYVQRAITRFLGKIPLDIIEFDRLDVSMKVANGISVKKITLVSQDKKIYMNGSINTRGGFNIKARIMLSEDFLSSVANVVYNLPEITKMGKWVKGWLVFKIKITGKGKNIKLSWL